MADNIDYLAMERKKDLNEGSFNAMVKDLVVAIRYVRESIPATEMSNHMPDVYALESKLHEFDNSLGEPRREYVKEIWEVLDNEPQPDKSKSFAICELGIRNEDEIVLFATGNSFPQHIIAEEWIKESGTKGVRYVILEVIEPNNPEV